MEKISQGAEAVITKDSGIIAKERIKKSYRIPEIDEKLRERRTRLEARLLREARRAGVATPQVLEEDKYTIKMEFVRGEKVRDFLNAGNAEKIGRIIGDSVGRMHKYNIIHGDLTTSNMIHSNDAISFIDFGLGFPSQRDEDKATDLHLLHQALESTHFDVIDIAWNAVVEGYSSANEGAGKVLKTLSKIEKRGRYVKER